MNQGLKGKGSRLKGKGFKVQRAKSESRVLGRGQEHCKLPQWSLEQSPGR